VLLKFTYYGDANGDGVVNGDDYNLIDTGFSGGGTGWLFGDFNHDGVINGDDYNLIDTAFGAQTGPLAVSNGGSIQAVPEPATNALLLLGSSLAFLKFRHRKNK
jgi:hypothetical protein